MLVLLSEISDSDFFLLGYNRQYIVGDTVWKRGKNCGDVQYKLWPYTYHNGRWISTSGDAMYASGTRCVTVIKD